MTNVFQTIWKKAVEAADTNFVISVDKIYNVGWKYEFDGVLCDANQKVSRYSGNVLVTLHPEEGAPVTKTLAQSDAHNYCASLLNDKACLFWYAKDSLLDELW